MAIRQLTMEGGLGPIHVAVFGSQSFVSCDERNDDVIEYIQSSAFWFCDHLTGKVFFPLTREWENFRPLTSIEQWFSIIKTKGSVLGNDPYSLVRNTWVQTAYHSTTERKMNQKTPKTQVFISHRVYLHRHTIYFEEYWCQFFLKKVSLKIFRIAETTQVGPKTHW